MKRSTLQTSRVCSVVFRVASPIVVGRRASLETVADIKLVPSQILSRKISGISEKRRPPRVSRADSFRNESNACTRAGRFLSLLSFPRNGHGAGASARSERGRRRVPFAMKMRWGERS